MSNQQFIHLKLWFPHTELGSSCNSLSFKSQFVGLPLNLGSFLTSVQVRLTTDILLAEHLRRNHQR